MQCKNDIHVTNNTVSLIVEMSPLVFGVPFNRRSTSGDQTTLLVRMRKKNYSALGLRQKPDLLQIDTQTWPSSVYP